MAISTLSHDPKEHICMVGISFPILSSAARLSHTSFPELCYTIQYVEQNGRQRGDPWSLRQTGIYQQVSSEANNSIWTILSPSPSIQEYIEQTLQGSDPGSCDGQATHPLLLHVIVLLATTDNWVGYIKHLQIQADEMVSRSQRIQNSFMENHAEFINEKGREGIFFETRDQQGGHGKKSCRLYSELLGHTGVATASTKAAADVNGILIVSGSSTKS